MNLTGGTNFSGPLRYELENYFPEAHYKKAVDKAFKEKARDNLRPDGGNKTQYYWSGEDGLLYHTETNNDRIDPFFNTIEQAEQFLENQADQNGKQNYTNMILRKSGNRKVKEATEVLTQQAGINDW